MPDRAPSAFVSAFALLVTFALAALPAWGQSSSNSFTLQVQRVGAGGGSASSPSFTADAATGQAAVGPSTSTSFRTGSGFVYPLDPNNEPLPVELTSFEAAQTEARAVWLRWQTASETNNAGFRVEHRRPEATVWTQLGFVESKASGGTTTAAKNYQYTAEDLAVGRHAFRLEQVDVSGATHVHEPVSIRVTMQELLRLSAPAPNPVSGTATLRFAVREQTEVKVTLYNTLGQRVRTLYRGTPTAGNSQRVRLEATGLPSGTYFLRLRAGGKTRTQPITVVR